MAQTVKKKHPYYNFNRISSYNAKFSGVCGGRGLGKTYGAIKSAIKAYQRTEVDQFIYLRRFKTELAAAKRTFFDAFIANNEFPDWDFRVNGDLAEMVHHSSAGEKKREWKIIGYFIALSQAQNQKSVAFPNVKTIIFDEFIIEKGATHYLGTDETTVFLNFYSTVDRWQDKTKVWFLANSVSIMNPYFRKWDIEPDKEQNRIVRRGNGYVAFDFPDSEDFASSVFETEFGKFIQGTDFADFAVGNKFKDNNDQLIREKDPKARYMFTLETRKGAFSVWRNNFTGNFWIGERKVGNEQTFTLVPEWMSESKTLMTYRDKPLAYLRASFGTGKVGFDRPATRNIFAEIFSK